MNIEGIDIEKVSVLSLQPKDILVFKIGTPISVTEAARIRIYVQRVLLELGMTNEVIVLNDGVELEIIRTMP